MKIKLLNIIALVASMLMLQACGESKEDKELVDALDLMITDNGLGKLKVGVPVGEAVEGLSDYDIDGKDIKPMTATRVGNSRITFLATANADVMMPRMSVFNPYAVVYSNTLTVVCKEEGLWGKISKSLIEKLEDKGFSLVNENDKCAELRTASAVLRIFSAERNGKSQVKCVLVREGIPTTAVQSGYGYGNSYGGSPSSSSNVQSNYGSDDLAFLATKKLTYDDISSLSKEQLRLLRNAIYARHGYKFRDPKLAEYFSRFPWYEPRYTDVTSMLNSVEQYNVVFIQKYEK